MDIREADQCLKLSPDTEDPLKGPLTTRQSVFHYSTSGHSQKARGQVLNEYSLEDRL